MGFIFFIMISSNVYAANYIQDIKVTKNNVGTKIDIIASSEIKYSAGKLSYNKKIYFDFFDTIIREKKTVI